MAADAVDAAVSDGHFHCPASATEHIPLLGAEGYQSRWDERHRLADESGLSERQIEHLLRRYGGRASYLLDLIADRPGLSEPVPGGGQYLQAEVVYAVT